MKKVLLIAVMMMTIFCFSQGRYVDPNIYGNIRYQAESFEERAYVPMELAKRHENNRKYLSSLKEWILDIQSQMASEKHIEALDEIYDELVKIQNRNLAQYSDFLAEVEDAVRYIISNYNTWLREENERKSYENSTKKILADAFSYYKNKEYAQAIISFSKYLEQDRNNTDVLFYRALVKSEYGDREGAIADYDKILELHSNYPLRNFKIATAYNNKAYCLVELRKYSEALPLVNKALELDKTESYIWDTRGEIYYNLGEYYKCIEDMSKAISIGESDNSYYIRGLAYIKLNNKNKACADLLKASELGNYEATKKRKEFCN